MVRIEQQNSFKPVSKGSEPGLQASRRLNCPEHTNKILTPGEQRKEYRVVSMFRPCCIDFGDQAYLGVIKNISAGGAQIYTNLPLNVGDQITYHWDRSSHIVAQVVWQKKQSFGLKNCERKIEYAQMQPTRSVRVPCEILATIWMRGEPISCVVSNVSLSGLCVFGVDEAEVGKLVTVIIGPFTFQSTTVRWCEYGSVGLSFSQSLRLEELMRLLHRVH